MKFVTSLVLTLPYITLNFLILFEDYCVSKFHLNVYTEMLQMMGTFFSNCRLAGKIIGQ